MTIHSLPHLVESSSNLADDSRLLAAIVGLARPNAPVPPKPPLAPPPPPAAGLDSLTRRSMRSNALDPSRTLLSGLSPAPPPPPPRGDAVPSRMRDDTYDEKPLPGVRGVPRSLRRSEPGAPRRRCSCSSRSPAPPPAERSAPEWERRSAPPRRSVCRGDDDDEGEVEVGSLPPERSCSRDGVAEDEAPVTGWGL